MSAANYLDAAIAIDSRCHAVACREVDRFFRVANIFVEPVTLQQAELARQAYYDFGNGRHPAGLLYIGADSARRISFRRFLNSSAQR